MGRVLAGAVGILFAAAVAAQGAFPSRPLTIVVGFEPGGGTDTTARILQKPLADQLGQQIVIENRAGAGGNIAVDYVAKQAPDGYMLVLANVGALAVNPHILKTPYDPLKDLTPISMAAVFPNVLIVQPALSVNSVADLVKLAREKPGSVTYASSGIGGAGHLAGELFRMVAKIDLVHVPYKGGAPAMQGFLGGQVSTLIATPVSSVAHVRAGKARAVATTGSRRAALMPDVPTIAESGYPGYEVLNWYGFLGPARMPKDLVERWNRELVKALGNPEAAAQMHKTGVEPQSSTPAEFAGYIEREYRTWGKVVKEAGIKPQ